MCIADRFGGEWKTEAGNALPVLVRSVVRPCGTVVAPVLHRDSRWDTSLVEAKFRLVLVAYEPPQ